MERDSRNEPLAVLVGPTAAGKTEAALELARRHGAEIVSMDSMLVYRGMDVGTAKPSEAERARVPHHLIDLVDPPERFDVTRWLAACEEACEDVRARGRRPLLVGGTGLYLQALRRGLFPMPEHDPALRAELQARVRREGLPALVKELERVDPALLERVHGNDEKRVLRGLEVWHQTGRRLSEWQTQWYAEREPRPLRLVGLAPRPEVLEERIARRTRAMLAQGWVEEVRRIAAGPGFGPTSIQALGYREILRHLAGELDLAALEAEIRLRTRQFARRQRTWFRRFEDVRWFEVSDEASPNETRAALGAALGW